MRTDKILRRNRKLKKEPARRLQSENPGLEVVHPHAAGIDVGNSAYYVAVRPDRDSQPVRRFECFTADLHRLANWLQSCGVKRVAAKIAYLRVAEQFVPTTFQDPDVAHLLAAAVSPRLGSGHPTTLVPATSRRMDLNYRAK
jgi:hypothetical protein